MESKEVYDDNRRMESRDHKRRMMMKELAKRLTTLILAAALVLAFMPVMQFRPADQEGGSGQNDASVKSGLSGMAPEEAKAADLDPHIVIDDNGIMKWDDLEELRQCRIYVDHDETDGKYELTYYWPGIGVCLYDSLDYYAYSDRYKVNGGEYEISFWVWSEEGYVKFWSTKINYKPRVMPPLVLDPNFSSPNIGWDPVEGADHYTITIDGYKVNTTDTHLNIEELISDLVRRGNARYDVYWWYVPIEAIDGNGETIARISYYFDYSPPLELQFGAFINEEELLEWCLEDEAAAYQVTIDEDSEPVFITSFEPEETRFDLYGELDRLAKQYGYKPNGGKYLIKIHVFDKDGNVIKSWLDWIEYVPKTNGGSEVQGGSEVYPAKAKLAYTSIEYDGKVKKPGVTVTANVNGAQVKLKEGVDYKLMYSAGSPVNKGIYKVIVIGLNSKYDCGITLTYTITQAKSSLAVTAKKPAVRYSKLKKKNQTIKKTAAYKVSKKNGKLTYKKISVAKKKFANKFNVNKTNGNITVKKGLKKGIYKVKVRITDAGDRNHKGGYKDVTVTVRVK